VFAGRQHQTIIELLPGEERLYRLPPMSAGPVIVRAFDASFTAGPHGTAVPHTGPTGDLDLELRHSAHLSQPGTNQILVQSLWQDDLWRLRVKRHTVSPTQALRYRIQVQYMSQLPVLERQIPASFFHDGFAINYNRQQYIKVNLIANTIEIKFDPSFAALYGLTEHVIDTSPVSFSDVSMTSLTLDVGAGPAPLGGGNAPFFSVRAVFPAVHLNVDLPVVPDFDEDLPASFIEVRCYLTVLGGLAYLPVIESNLLDLLDFDVHIPDPGEIVHTVNLKAYLKKKIEDALYRLQMHQGTGFSAFGEFLSPWLIGSQRELFSLGYAPGPGDGLSATGVVEPATGQLVVRYVGPRPTPVASPPLTMSDGSGPTAPPDDGAIPLFDLADEEPDPLPPAGDDGLGAVTPFGSGGPHPHPNIGALSKIDHIVVLMQENRSFDQVLGYLSRDKINPDVEGLLPPDNPGSQAQFNRFPIGDPAFGRNFFPQKSDPGKPPRARATAWPSFAFPGPCHEHDCVVRQMNNMGGFVADFAGRLGITDPSGAEAQESLRLVMDYFGPDDLPVYAALAREFGVCDHWFTSHVGSTFPNRFVLLTGDLNRDPVGNVELDEPELGKMTPIQRPTLFDHLDRFGVSWRLFEHGYCFLRMFGRHTFDVTNIVSFDDPLRGFEAAARGGTLPSVTLIEPDYIDLPPGNDDHPPTDMAEGQNLVNRILQALLTSPNWERTLFVITYDEHGGFYDHVQPPNDAAPIGGSLTVLGPRVPALVISPLVERGKVFHSRFDHTSIGATILRRFCARPPRISPRLDAALDLREVLTLDAPRPRSDFASLVAPPPTPPHGGTGLDHHPVHGGTHSGVSHLPAGTVTHAGGTVLVSDAPSPGPTTAPGALASPVMPGLIDRRKDARRAKPIGPRQGNDDFHWLLAAVRLTTGEPPRA
jgi:phospholipase C